jgi:pyruvate/oxaloacetate carboxyltransferase
VSGIEVTTPSILHTFEIITAEVVTEVEVDSNALRHAEGIQDTSTTYELISVVRAVTSYTNTEVRNEVPNTSGVVTAKKVAQVEQSLLLQIPVLNLVSVSVSGDNTLTVHSIELGAETDTGSEPLTDSYRETKTTTEILQRTLRKAFMLLFVRVECAVSKVSLDEPVAPERISGYTVLQSGLFLSHTCQ